jgi:hypothetical protein
MKTQTSPFKNLHLLVSVILIGVIGAAYGFFPEKIVPALAGYEPGNTDISNAFKAIMGLYVGVAAFWLLGVLRPSLWYAATLLNIFFMLGLASGRLLSLALDGIPSEGLLVGLGLEFLLGLWGILSLRAFAKPLVREGF